MYQYRVIHIDQHGQVIGDEMSIPASQQPDRVRLIEFLNQAGKEGWRVVMPFPTQWRGATSALLLEKSQSE